MKRLTTNEMLLASNKRLRLKSLKHGLYRIYLPVFFVIVILMIGFVLISGQAVSFSILNESAEFQRGDLQAAKAVFFVFRDFQANVARALNKSVFCVLAVMALVLLLFYISIDYLRTITHAISQWILPNRKVLPKILLEEGEKSGLRLLRIFRISTPCTLGFFVIIGLYVGLRYKNDIDSYFMFFSRFLLPSIVVLILTFCLFDSYTGRQARLMKMMKQKKVPKRERLAYFAESYLLIVAHAAFLYIALILLSLGIEAVGLIGIPTVNDQIDKLVEIHAARLSETGVYKAERAIELMTLSLQPYRQGRLRCLELINHIVFNLGKCRNLVLPFIAIFGIYDIAIPLYRLEVNKPTAFVLISLCTMLITTFLIETFLPSMLGIIKDSFTYRIGLMTITFVLLLLIERIGHYCFRK